MSEPIARRVLVGALTTLVGVVVIAIWHTKVDTSDFEMHVQQEAATRDAILDILCADHPTHRRCR